MNSTRLVDRVCIITGGGSGIGRVIAVRFAPEGGVVAGDEANRTFDVTQRQEDAARR